MTEEQRRHEVLKGRLCEQIINTNENDGIILITVNDDECVVRAENLMGSECKDDRYLGLVLAALFQFFYDVEPQNITKRVLDVINICSHLLAIDGVLKQGLTGEEKENATD